MSLYGSSLAPHSRPSLSLVSIMRAVSPTSEDITGGFCFRREPHETAIGVLLRMTHSNKAFGSCRHCLVPSSAPGRLLQTLPSLHLRTLRLEVSFLPFAQAV